jgi:hypothetical protein
VPWNQFGYDLGGGSYDADFFEEFLAEAEAGGQNGTFISLLEQYLFTNLFKLIDTPISSPQSAPAAYSNRPGNNALITAARFWVHCDGRNSPTFDDSSRMVKTTSDHQIGKTDFKKYKLCCLVLINSPFCVS